MKHRLVWTKALAFGLLALGACSMGDNKAPIESVHIVKAPQRAGDATRGYDVLVYGDTVRSGVPIEIFKTVFGQSALDLDRTGTSEGIPYDYNTVTHESGVTVVAPNCLTCHAQPLFGQLVIGLGNGISDYTQSQEITVTVADSYVKQMYGENSPEYAAFLPFKRGAAAIAPNIFLEKPGVNPADKIFAVLAAHRDPTTLAWSDTPNSEIPATVVPTDVPPWWNIRKKSSLYYNGLGQGDFGRLSSASAMLTLANVDEAAAADQDMPDMMEWIASITPPAYPFAIDAALAATGRGVFEATCARCHGTYGDNPSYPQLVVALDAIGTDPMLATSYTDNSGYMDWYNSSWYGAGDAKAQLLPQDGYVPPPLDGIWATAPFLHNGSVPTLEALLNSAIRPTIWLRSFTTEEADFNQHSVGWNWEPAEASNLRAYDTSLPGYGNQGHTYGDALSDADRRAVIEYLKTL